MAIFQNLLEIQREIMGFCWYFAVVVHTHTHSQRVAFADVFIVKDFDTALVILRACFFGKNPYIEDRTYRTYREGIRQQLQLLDERDFTTHRIGNNRLFNGGI